jgi:hypothetical protein
MEEKMKHIAFVISSIALFAVLAAVPLTAQNAGALKDLSFVQDNGKAVILIKVDGRFTYETSTMTMPRRLIIDLTPIDAISAPPFLQVGYAGIISIRTGQNKPQTARVVFDLSDQNSAQTISAVPDGLKVSFSLESGAAAAKEPARRENVREIPQSEVRTALGDSSVAGDRLNFFFRAGAGLTLFLKPEMVVNHDFLLYGETGTANETYSFKNGLVFDGSVGKYFALGNSRLKAGLGFSYWKLPNEGLFTLTVPHPFLTNSPRTATLDETEGLRTQMMSFYAYALFSFVDTESFSIFFGPLLGFSTGKFLSLSDWDLEEKTPFTSADVTIVNPVYFEDSIAELMFGASLSMELSLGRSFALVLDTKMVYINPSITNLGKRANLLQLQPTLGIQFSF